MSSKQTRSDLLYMQDMEDAMNRIFEYVGEQDYLTIKSNQLLVDGILRNLEIVGEAAGKVSLEIKGRYPQIEWSRMTRTRNRLAHEYYRIDLEVVWRIIIDYLPQNLLALELAIAESKMGLTPPPQSP